MTINHLNLSPQDARRTAKGVARTASGAGMPTPTGMTGPVRIQRKRTKGWRGHHLITNDLPIIYVNRPLKYGNPFEKRGAGPEHAERVVKCFRSALMSGRLDFTIEDVRRDLANNNLGCFCPLDQPCHADVLLELANA